jgi:hypothetical protein
LTFLLPFVSSKSRFRQSTRLIAGAALDLLAMRQARASGVIATSQNRITHALD